MRAAWSLAILPLKESPDVIKAFCTLLKSDPSGEIRLQCAIGLMRAKTIEARDAYIQAVHDTNEKVAMIACGQLIIWGGEESSTALYETLSSRSWRVRLEACKSLIMLKTADKRVVIALEKMSKQREAKKYNAQMEEFDKIPFEMPGEPKIETWGKIEAILEQARQIAALND